MKMDSDDLDALLARAIPEPGYHSGQDSGYSYMNCCTPFLYDFVRLCLKMESLGKQAVDADSAKQELLVGYQKMILSIFQNSLLPSGCHAQEIAGFEADDYNMPKELLEVASEKLTAACDNFHFILGEQQNAIFIHQLVDRIIRWSEAGEVTSAICRRLEPLFDEAAAGADWGCTVACFEEDFVPYNFELIDAEKGQLASFFKNFFKEDFDWTSEINDLN